MRPFIQLSVILLGLTFVAMAQQAAIPVRLSEAVSHRIGDAPVVRAASVPQPNQIEVAVTVSANGYVVKASAADSQQIPAVLRQRAAAAVMGERYRPFVIAGRPRAVTFDTFIAVLPPEEKPPWHVPFPVIHDWNKVSISLYRSSCLGMCPAYQVTIHGDGTVRYEGAAWVAFTGVHHGRVPRAQVRALVQAFRQADFFSLNNGYGPTCCDAPTYIVSLHDGHRSHFVRDFMGPDSGMPASVTKLEEEIDRIAGTKRWIEGDATTIASLQAEGWDFGAPAAARTLVALARQGDARLIPAMLEAGVNPSRAGEALAAAARRAGPAVLTALLAAGANQHQPQLNQALLAAARVGRTPSMHLLIGAGADPHAIGTHGETLLTAAAGSGVPAAVQMALGYGLNVNHQDADGNTALIEAFIQPIVPLPPQANLAAVARLLLARGADPNLRDHNGDTALIEAGWFAKVAQVLVEHGASVNVEGNYGVTPLMEAMTVSVAKVLIAAGADPNYRNRKGETVFTTHLPLPAEVLAYLKNREPGGA